MANDVMNVRVKKKENDLFIKIDMGEDFGPSSTGRSHIVAGARWLKLDEALNDPSLEGYKLNIQVIKPKPKKAKVVDSFDEDPDFDESEKVQKPKTRAKPKAEKPAVKKPSARSTRAATKG